MQDSNDDKAQDASDILENGINGVNNFVKKDLPALKDEFNEAKENIGNLASDLKKDIAGTKEELSSFVDDFKEVKSALKDMFKLF
jgi:uncharacterized protein YjbJ (UPF0337 family)